MFYEIVKFVTIGAFIFGGMKATKEMTHLTRHHRHLQDSVYHEMSMNGQVDLLQFRHKVDSLHRFELIRLGYERRSQ